MDIEDVLKLSEDLIHRLRHFVREEPQATWPQDFGRYLLSADHAEEKRLEGGVGTESVSEFDHDHDHDHGFDDTALGVILISLSNRIRRNAARRIRQSPFASVMDYQFLFTLRVHGTLSKSALIEANGMELTSGAEVIKRIGSQAWIEESPNPDDRRSRLVTITDAGVAVEESYRPVFRDYYASLSLGLTREQKVQLVDLAHRMISGQTSDPYI